MISTRLTKNVELYIYPNMMKLRLTRQNCLHGIMYNLLNDMFDLRIFNDVNFMDF